MIATAEADTQQSLYLRVLGRTLEHLGVQMYKRRDVAIAELVANCWDAGATQVKITVPEAADYDQPNSRITITDNGSGMDQHSVQHNYLVVGKNRREVDGEEANGRLVMGRKGIGKLAGFGIATQMIICTWQGESSIEFTLDLNELKVEDDKSDGVPISAIWGGRPIFAESENGTRVSLHQLKHKTPLHLNDLHESLGRRFSRVVRGEMEISINGEALRQPDLPLSVREPKKGIMTHVLPDGSEVRYFYGFAQHVIRSSQLRGFAIYVRGKIAQAPPYYFNTEGTASGQHGTKYLTGEIHADFLDLGTEDNDLISTDRQEIDWEDERTEYLRSWGDQLTRKALREWADRRGDDFEVRALQDPDLLDRYSRLDQTSQRHVSRILKSLGTGDPSPDREVELASTIIRAFEYRHFHDVIESIEAASADPFQLESLLSHMAEWRVLESRAILEIINGRLRIVEKFHSLVVNDAPETASKLSPDNMHDLIGGNPWLLNPDWQVLSEEKTITLQLREWAEEDSLPEYKQQRYDFLALSDDNLLVIIEIKRSGHAVTFPELQRLEQYKVRLSKGQPNIRMVLISGGSFDVPEGTLKQWRSRDDLDLLEWNEIYQKTLRFYSHYRDVLEGNVRGRGFAIKEWEVSHTRQVLEQGTVHRNAEERAKGLGPQNDELEP